MPINKIGARKKGPPPILRKLEGDQKETLANTDNDWLSFKLPHLGQLLDRIPGGRIKTDNERFPPSVQKQNLRSDISELFPSRFFFFSEHSSNTVTRMAQQDHEGWPLGLQPLNVRIGLARNHDNNNSGSVSFNTLLTVSPPSSSTDSSSDLDTQSTGSFFLDKSTTLGSLLGVSSILELSRRSLRGVKAEVLKSKKNIGNKSNWTSCLSLMCVCSRKTSLHDDDDDNGEKVEENGASSLGDFLAGERRAANESRRNQSILPMYGPEDEFVLAQTQSVDDDEPNSLFVNGSIAPPLEGFMPRKSFERDGESRGLSTHRNNNNNNRFGSLVKLFLCASYQQAVPG
ncbi:60S Ribosomal protein [Senna tora]|uniref:60S Ribosomal protein n=1 Tax=Senna tora TaxID=362788 RepID=A0A834TMI3_9FABA|nr:60S Ribosomal protein [Senna tora]